MSGEAGRLEALKARCNPAYADNPVMEGAWLAFVQWAIGEEGARAAFERETGAKWSPPKNGLERMIDEATGHAESYVADFAEWITRNEWGRADDPAPLHEPPQ